MATSTRLTGGVQPVPHEHRVTSLELFFDLVFVFAFTQLSALISHVHDFTGIVRGTLLLALIWWSWSAYAWLGNQGRADTGVARFGLIVAMAAMFVLALAIPGSWPGRHHGLRAPLTLAIAYTVVRAVHMLVYAAAAAGDPGLRRQLLVNLVPLLAGLALLVAGALVGGSGQTALWATALVADWLGVYVTSRGGGGWRIHSVSHWVERHGLIVLLALGESVAAIGAGAAGRPMSSSLVTGATLGILIAAALWWLYFDTGEDEMEEVMTRMDRAARVRAAIVPFTYVFFLLVLGVVVAAVGVREALAHAGLPRRMGAFDAGVLCGGPALYVAALALFWWTLDRRFERGAAVAAALLLMAWPLAARLPALTSLVLVLMILSVRIAWETFIPARRAVGS